MLNLKDIKNKINVCKKIGNKIEKGTIFVIFDAFKCNLKYGSSFKNYVDFEFYFLNEIERRSYLTDKTEKLIIKKYNNLDYLNKLYDRVYFCNIFKDYIHREFIDIREISFKDFREFINDKDKIIIKHISGNSDEEIIDIDKTIIKNEYNVLKLYNSILKKEKFLVMEHININKNFLSICGNSQLIVYTFLDDEMKTYILKVIVKNDDFYAFVNNQGVIFTPFIDKNGNIYCNHPNTNKEALGFQVPFYEELNWLMNKCVKNVSNTRYLAWNILVSDKGLALTDLEDLSDIYEIKASINSNKKGSLENYQKYM